ncbi:uncharacterized protein EAE98_005456 [Botrytis deweyae]|uniref:Uncharacterized protein n=1 Tax=Botrytis deweyae TaxID=2478750 RepID=A0ABQ7IPE7_9HELO|nr:uncharacterized protein EAE98_005456 [Botrytis deweyae]KAF7929538.1 hypothetical protein EAE98_005456 [Botrytis deweyae]
MLHSPDGNARSSPKALLYRYTLTMTPEAIFHESNVQVAIKTKRRNAVTRMAKLAFNGRLGL